MNLIITVQIAIMMYLIFITVGAMMAFILNQITKHRRNDLEDEIQGILNARVFIFILLIPIKNIVVFRTLVRALRWYILAKNRKKLQ